MAIKLFHAGSRTSMWDRLADPLSNGNMEEVDSEMRYGPDVSARASKLLRWLGCPYVQRSLGRKGLQEIGSQCEVELGSDSIGQTMSQLVGNTLLGEGGI